MSSHERFKANLLARLARLGEDGWQVRTSLLAFDYGVPEAKVRQMLVQWAQEGLIWLGADDAAAIRPWNEWKSADEMFAESSHIRIKILPPSQAAAVEPIAESGDAAPKLFHAVAS